MRSRPGWTSRGTALLATLLIGFSAVPLAAGGAGFRVENKVFVGGEDEPRAQSTTIFYQGAVYDFLDSPNEITVFDPEGGRFVLLDPAKRIRTELSTDQIEVVIQRLRDWSSSHSGEYRRFLADPEFEVTFDAGTNELELDSEWLTYQLVTAPVDDSEMVRQYCEFCDWLSRLNTRINPGSRPPFARIEVNARLKEAQRMPVEVHLTLRPQGRGFLYEKISARSEHQVVRHLLESDRDRIAQTDQFMAMFQPLDFDEYQRQVRRGQGGEDR